RPAGNPPHPSVEQQSIYRSNPCQEKLRHFVAPPHASGPVSLFLLKNKLLRTTHACDWNENSCCTGDTEGCEAWRLEQHDAEISFFVAANTLIGAG
ncbi:MAG: hypothetical protein MUF20_08695, partial [Methylotetracoccus sp.]|nr:hypothetical protein [Methylotetracoccus sp.]